MSQQRSEFFNYEQRSNSPTCDDVNPSNLDNSVTESLTAEECPTESKENSPSSSSPSNNSSCGLTLSEDSSEIASSERTSVTAIQNTNDLYNPFEFHTGCVEDSSDRTSSERSSSKSVASGNEELTSTSDTSRSSSTSGSEAESNHFHQFHRSRDIRKEAIVEYREDQHHSHNPEDFESVDSEEDEDESLCFDIAEENRSNRGSSYPQTYYSSWEEPKEQRENRGTRLLRRLDNFLDRMFRRHKELCVIVLIIVSGLASLRSSPAKIRATSVPGPFFEEKDVSYFLQDNYMGEYVDLANKQIPYHPSFLFYYAPWDSESVASRSVFLNVAKHFYFTHHGRVKFYAINCWWPGGQCRKNYKNLSHYPIFVAHIGKAAGIIYNGPIRTQPIIKFLNSLLKPVTRIDTEDELWNFRAQHDVIMLGYFNFTHPETNEAYETYLQMALRTFEADPFNQVGFGLFLRPELAEKFFLSTSNAISLVLFNEIHTAKWHGGYHGQGLKGPVGQVAEWIIERTKSVPITWVYALRNGFANRPAALGPQDFAQQLSQGPVFLLISRRYFPSGHSPFYMQVKEVALDYFNCNRSGNVTKLRRTSHKINSGWASIWNSVVEICQRKGSFQCQHLLPNIQHWNKKRALFKRESLLHYENISTALNFTGLSCISERQFKFLAIDPVDVPYFINLGLSGLKNADDTKYSIEIDPMAFIIDSQNDVILPLPSLNITEMAMAIYNYTLATENNSIDSLQSQLYLHKKGNEATSSNQEANKLYRQETGILESWGSDDLLQYVKGNSNDSALVLYTASFCGYCALAVTHLVALSRFLEDNYGNESLKVKLVKIDMFKNSLPAELNPEKLPTITFMPAWNRTDVKMYPENQEVTSMGLLRFILSELEPSARVQASLMSPSCGPNNRHCKVAKSEVDCQLASSSTSLWRNTSSSGIERLSCIKSSRNSVSSQIELLLQRLQNGEEAMFDYDEAPFQSLTTQAWNGQILDRLRTMAVTLDVS